MSNNVILSLDLGTNSIHGVLASYKEDNKIEILSADTFSSDGIKCGAISDINAAEITVDKFLTKADTEFGFKEVKMVCAIRGSQIEVFNASAGLGLKNMDDSSMVNEDTILDIRNRLEEINKIAESKETIEIIPQQYKLDDQEVQNPIDMYGKFLELSAFVVVASKSFITNIRRATKGTILRYGYTTVADTLVTDDRNFGCVLVDIGGMTTGVVVYVDGKLKHSFELNFGSDYITRDILKKLRITLKEAKDIKEKYGCVLEELITENTEFEYNVPGNQKQKYTVRQLVDIIKPQVDLQLSLLLDTFEQKGIKVDELIGGFLLTGGGSLLKGMPEAFDKYFGTAAKCVNFTEDDFVCSDANIIYSQTYTTALSVLKNKSKNLVLEEDDEDDDKENKPTGIIETIKGWLQEFKKMS